MLRLPRFVRNAIRRVRRSKAVPDAPLYFTSLSKKSDDDWRAALGESPENAAKWVYAAAIAGDNDAQMLWGRMLLDGYGTKADADAAYRWFGIAATHRRPDAVTMLGRCHERGWGVAPDDTEAAALYREAAAANEPWALFNLASLMLDGRGLAQDRDGAFRRFVQAALRGNNKAPNMIGHCYENGWGCARDLLRAAHWYRRAADAGDFRGAYRLGQWALEAGRIDDALTHLRAAVDNAPAPFCQVFAEELQGQPDPRLRTLGAHASARAGRVMPASPTGAASGRPHTPPSLQSAPASAR